MTLNITVVSTGGIHQSSDFRLSNFKRGPDGQYVPIEGNSPKLVALQYKNWAGYLTYCGVGKWDHKSTYDTATEWISSLGPNAMFDDVARSIEAQGSSWIQSIQSQLGTFQGHTFILAAFESGRPRVAVISNTHSTKGPIARSVKAGLQASFGADSGTHIYVTGLDNAVSKENRVALKRLIESKADPNVVRHRLARINAMASERIEARNGISTSCMCYSIDGLGGGGGEIHGQVTGRLVPIHLTNGLNLFNSVGLRQLLGPNAQIRGSSFATSDSSNAAEAEHIECSLEITGNDRPSILAGHDLGQMNERHLEIASANERRSIVGQLRRPVRAPPQAFLWIDGSEIAELQTLGGSMSNAMDVNNANVVVGSCTTVSGEWRATLWRPGEPVLDLGTLDANNANSKAINDQNVVVGVVYRSPAAPQADYRRAFRWTSSEGMTLIPGTEDLWSSAQDVNNRGDILGWCRGPKQMRSFVWSQSAGLRFVEGTIGKPFYASRINDSGVVIGEADDDRGVRRAMVWSSETGLLALNVPFEFHPTAIDAVGNIVGHDSKGPWSGAWLVTTRGDVISIPAGADHNVDARSIAGGSIFGHARKGSWKHVHPMRWDFASGSKSL